MTITIGLKTKTHILLCSQTVLSSSIIKIKDDYSYTNPIFDVLTSVSGDQGDSFRIFSFLKEYSKMLTLKYKEKVTPELISRLFSSEVHSSLREKRLEVQGIVGGRSEDNSLKLFGIDKYGALQEDNFIVTGYGLYFLLGIFDMLYNEDMKEEDALTLLRECIKTLKERLILDVRRWKIDIIGPEGMKSDIIEI